MEEKNKDARNEQKKYSYEELSTIAGNLFQENKELKKRMDVMNEALSDLQTQNLFAYVGMLNKMLDNAIHFKPDFVDEVADDLMNLKRKIGSMFFGSEEGSDRDIDKNYGGEEESAAEAEAE